MIECSPSVLTSGVLAASTVQISPNGGEAVVDVLDGGAAKEAKDAERAAGKAKAAADNLMEAAPDGTALTPAQCKMISTAIAEDPCGCD